MAADSSIPPEEQKGFFAAFVQNHVAATLVALAFVVAGLAALFSGKVLREVESSLVDLDSTPAADPQDELAARRSTRAS